MRKFDGYAAADAAQIRAALDSASQMTIDKAKLHGTKIAGACTENNFYEYGENVAWTAGFWPGEMWLAYEHTHDAGLKKTALEITDSFLDRIEKKIDVNHHDMGFLFSLSCISAYQLTGSDAGRRAAILAADNLISRFVEKGQFIQAWGDVGAADNYRLIIDCFLNLPPLFRVSEITGDEKYAEVAKKHIKTASECFLREDGSTYHTFYFDLNDGHPLYGETAQGNRDGSAWARGQAWGVCGAALAYKYTKSEKCLELFRRTAEYFLGHLPQNLVPYWDFDFTDPSDEPRDSSAGAIAVCGLLEMSELLDGAEAEYYRDAALKLLKALIDNCAVRSLAESDGLLLHSTYCKSTPTNHCDNIGVDECASWGDYFYFEALTRAAGKWHPYW